MKIGNWFYIPWPVLLGIVAVFLFLVLSGCSQVHDMTNVFSPSGEPGKVIRVDKCAASCVINDIQTFDEIISDPEVAKTLHGLIGEDTLRTYWYRLNDGREGILDPDAADTLKVGDLLPHCNVTEAVGSCPSIPGHYEEKIPPGAP